MTKENNETKFKVWRMSQASADFLARAIACKVVEMHNYGNRNPSCIFLTDTRATYFGWMFREAYKKAYPNEKCPKFYRADPGAFEYAIHNDKTESLRNYLAKRVSSERDRILVFDEESLTGKSPCLIARALVQYGSFSSGYKDEHCFSLRRGNVGVDRGSYNLDGSSRSLGEFFSENCLYQFIEKDSYPLEDEKLQTLLNRFSDDKDVCNKIIGLQNPPALRFKGKLLKMAKPRYEPRPGEPKSARPLDYIHDLKMIGRMAGSYISNGSSFFETAKK